MEGGGDVMVGEGAPRRRSHSSQASDIGPRPPVPRARGAMSKPSARASSKRAAVLDITDGVMGDMGAGPGGVRGEPPGARAVASPPEEAKNSSRNAVLLLGGRSLAADGEEGGRIPTRCACSSQSSRCVVEPGLLGGSSNVGPAGCRVSGDGGWVNQSRCSSHGAGRGSVSSTCLQSASFAACKSGVRAPRPVPSASASASRSNSGRARSAHLGVPRRAAQTSSAAQEGMGTRQSSACLSRPRTSACNVSLVRAP